MSTIEIPPSPDEKGHITYDRMMAALREIEESYPEEASGIHKVDSPQGFEDPDIQRLLNGDEEK